MNHVADLLSDLAARSDVAANLLRDCPDFFDASSHQLQAAFQLVCQIGFMADMAAQARGVGPRIGGAAEWFASDALRSPPQASSSLQPEGGAA